jgi:hypothetical protein
MTTMTFDKLAYVDKLKAAGFEDDKARAMAEGLDTALREQVATRADLTGLQAALRSDIKDVKHDVLRWMIGSQVVLAGFLLAAFKFIGH